MLAVVAQDPDTDPISYFIRPPEQGGDTVEYQMVSRWTLLLWSQLWFVLFIVFEIMSPFGWVRKKFFAMQKGSSTFNVARSGVMLVHKQNL